MQFMKVCAAIVLVGAATALIGQEQVPAPNGNADNTAVNKTDRDNGKPTADQQKMNRADRDLTKHIRHAVTSDKALSTYAHNIKIISQDGLVTLRGPVRSEEEKKSIVAKAIQVTGSAEKVDDELSVEPQNKN